MKNYSINQLHFWCQKVLPLVYDDSLSYYELLCKVVYKLNELIESENELREIVKNLETNISEIVNNILNEWLEDGTLKEIIGNNVPFLPTNAQMNDYRTDTLKCIASYFAVEYGSDCVIGKPTNAPEQVAISYRDQHTYTSLLSVYPDVRANGKNVFSDNIQVGNKNLHRMYLDCSAFLALITKCRPYLESPYYMAFTNPELSADNLLNYCFESGDLAHKPYTFDWLNWIITFRMAYMMNQSGNTVKNISTKLATSSKPTINEALVADMETGDILFRGSSVYAETRYKGISHCMYYLKTLDELNVYGSQYGITFKALDNETAKYGFVVHVTGSSDGKKWDEGGMKNVLRIETLYSIMTANPNNGEWSRVYVAKPYSNAFISSKAYNMFNGRFPVGYQFFETNCIDQTSMTYYGSSRERFFIKNIALAGTYPDQKNFDLNNIEAGFYCFNTSYHTVTNAPNTSAQLSYLMNVMGYYDGRGLQLFFDGDGNAWFRTRASSTTWLDWRKVTTTIDS